MPVLGPGHMLTWAAVAATTTLAAAGTIGEESKRAISWDTAINQVTREIVGDLSCNTDHELKAK